MTKYTNYPDFAKSKKFHDQLKQTALVRLWVKFKNQREGKYFYPYKGKLKENINYEIARCKAMVAEFELKGTVEFAKICNNPLNCMVGNDRELELYSSHNPTWKIAS